MFLKWDCFYWRTLYTCYPRRRQSGMGFSGGVCLFVFRTVSKKRCSHKITKRDIEMVHHESWKPFTLGSEGQRSGSRDTKNSTGVGFVTLVTLVSAGFF